MLNLVALNNRANKQKLKSVSRSLCRARGCAGLRGGGGEGAVWQRVVGCRWGAPAGEGHARRHGLRRRALHLQTRCVPTAFRLRSYCVPTASYCVLSADAHVTTQYSFVATLIFFLTLCMLIGHVFLFRSIFCHSMSCFLFGCLFCTLSVTMFSFFYFGFFGRSF